MVKERRINTQKGSQMAYEVNNKQVMPNNGDLPELVIREILVYLPIKSLFRFKSVSKQWNNLISDPFFARCYSCRCDHPHKATLWAMHYNDNK